MATFNLYLRETNSNTETPIILYVYHNKTRFKIPTGKAINPKYWNEAEQKARLVRDFPQGKIFNQILKNIKGEAEKCLLTLENELERNPTPKELKEAIIKELDPNVSAINNGGDDKLTFMQLFSRFIKESETGERLSDYGKRLSPLSIKKYKTAETRLSEFGRKYHLSFETIDANFYNKFLTFLNKEKYKPNTIGKYIQVIKTFMAYATENGYNTNLYFQSKKFKTFAETGFSIYLNESEINDLWKLDLSKNKRLEAVRDLFIVGCFTGLRYSDFSTLNPSHFQDDYIKIKTKKTGQFVTIPIHPIIKAILAKYDGLPASISNQKTNVYLKEITAMVPSLSYTVEVEQMEGGLKVSRQTPKSELVTTHTARRSFATNIYNSGKVTTFDIMSITGHKTETAFLKYIKVTPEESAKRLKSFWDESYLKVV